MEVEILGIKIDNITREEAENKFFKEFSAVNRDDS